MSALSIQPPFPVFTDIDGQPLEDGYIWIGTANLDPQTNPISVFFDAGLTIPAPQPIRTLSGYPARTGSPSRLYVGSDYSIRVLNKNGSVVYSAPAATERYSEIVVNGLDAADVSFTAPFSGAVTTDVEEALSRTVEIKDFGAVGDGVADDTPAFNAMDAYLNTVSDPVEVVINDGVYLVNPLATTNPLGGSNACLFRLYSNGSRVTGPGQIKINSAINYTAGFSAGDEKYWSVVQLDADDCTVEGLRFDGNGTNTAQGYNPSIVNIRWQLAASFGSVGSHRAGNKVIFCQGIDFGGQAVAFQYQDAALIGWNRFNNHSGVGVSVGSDAKILGNSLRTCYDAPIYLNPITGAKVLGNYISGTTNGSGIDIVGAIDTEVANNYVQDAFGSGIHVTYSAQQLVGCDRVHIHHNTFKSNAGYTSTPIVGEIKIGRDSNTPNSANNVLVENNIIIMDGSATATAGRPLITNYGVNNLVFRNNMIYGTANANNTFATIQQGIAGLEISGNRWLGSSTRQLIGVTAGAVNTNFRVYANDLIGFDPAGTLLPNGGVLQDDGSVVFSIQRNIPTSATTVLTATFLTGGSEHIVVDVVAVQTGEFRGVAQNKITARGTNAISPTVLANTSEVALGNNPPLVTTVLATGVLTVQLASVGATSDTNLAVRVRCKFSSFNLVFG
jgi:hypothetical protein